MSSILCDKIDDPAGQINCIKGLCETCGELALFPIKVENIDVTKKMNCKSYKYVKNETKLGKETKRLEYVEEELCILASMDKFKNLIQPYIHHAILQSGKHNSFKL